MTEDSSRLFDKFNPDDSRVTSLLQPSNLPAPIQRLFSLEPLRETAQRSTDTSTAFLPLSTLHSLGLQPVRLLFRGCDPRHQ